MHSCSIQDYTEIVSNVCFDISMGHRVTAMIIDLFPNNCKHICGILGAFYCSSHKCNFSTMWGRRWGKARLHFPPSDVGVHNFKCQYTKNVTCGREKFCPRILSEVELPILSEAPLSCICENTIVLGWKLGTLALKVQKGGDRTESPLNSELGVEIFNVQLKLKHDRFVIS